MREICENEIDAKVRLGIFICFVIIDAALYSLIMYLIAI